MIIGYKAMVNVDGWDFFLALVIYVGLAFIRGFVFIVLFPLLSKFGYGVTRQDATVAWWGGLRGSVGLALALNIFKEIYSLEKAGAYVPKANEGMQFEILFHMSMVVLLTVCVNATTMESLVAYLGMDELGPEKKATLHFASSHIRSEAIKKLEVLKRDRFLCDADWNIVR